MIRDVVTSDAASIAKLLRSLGYNSTEKDLTTKLAEYADHPDYKVMIDVDEDNVVHGVVALHTISQFHAKGKLGRIMSLVVDESYRGNRSGRDLLAAVESYFQSLGCPQCEVSAAISRSNARKLFKSVGYSEDERQLIKTFKNS